MEYQGNTACRCGCPYKWGLVLYYVLLCRTILTVKTISSLLVCLSLQTVAPLLLFWFIERPEQVCCSRSDAQRPAFRQTGCVPFRTRTQLLCSFLSRVFLTIDSSTCLPVSAVLAHQVYNAWTRGCKVWKNNMSLAGGHCGSPELYNLFLEENFVLWGCFWCSSLETLKGCPKLCARVHWRATVAVITPRHACAAEVK